MALLRDVFMTQSMQATTPKRHEARSQFPKHA
jgi:hypothetical protein